MLVGGVYRTISFSDGVVLGLIEAGDPGRPTLVFVHGYPDTKELWEGVLGRLAGRYHVVAYDVRGAGSSTAPRGPAAYDFERLADDLEGVIEAVSPKRKVHLIGHDWGAIQGWEFATIERFRDRLASFTAIAGPSLDQLINDGRALMAHPTRTHLAEVVRRLRRSWYVAALWIPGAPTLAWRGLLAGRRWAWLLRAVERIPGARPSPTLGADGAHGANLYRRNIPRRLIRPRREAVARVPVQLIVPTRDHFISPGYYESAARHAPNLRRRDVDTTHWVPRTRPDLVAGWIAEIVDDVEARAKFGQESGTR